MPKINTKLLTQSYPQTKSEFSAAANPGVTYETLGVGSRLEISWVCLNNKLHAWSSSPNQRTSGGKLRGCPYCAGKKVIPSESFKARYPELAKEWNPQNAINADGVTPKSNRKVYWCCSKNKSHVWIASPKQRVNGNTCPFCDSLCVKYPEIAAQWHPTLNSQKSAELTSPNAHTPYWWKCGKGYDHVWRASPNSRIANNSGCPICSGYKVVPSNSLAITNPEIAAQWDLHKNKKTPAEVYGGSHKIYWWKCKNGADHRWQATVRSRTSGLGCPACSGRKVVLSNSLRTLRPEAAALWNNFKNGELTPEDVTPFSGKKVWWQCPVGAEHQWQATVANVVGGSTCPVCMGRKITNSNSLSAKYPSLLKEWDYTKNTLDPEQISPGTKFKAWWQCERDTEHQWFSSVADRTVKNSGCPFCAIKLNVSELKMLDIIKALLPGKVIEYRKKPSWLNRLELDVFIPDMDLAFEYQGKQHLEPVEFFGGQETFISQVKRDELKKSICIERGITLIYVYYNEQLTPQLIKDKLTLAGLM